METSWKIDFVFSDVSQCSIPGEAAIGLFFAGVVLVFCSVCGAIICCCCCCRRRRGYHAIP